MIRWNRDISKERHQRNRPPEGICGELLAVEGVDLWYLVHVEGISIYCQETSCSGNQSLCRSMPKEHPAGGWQRKGG